MIISLYITYWKILSMSLSFKIISNLIDVFDIYIFQCTLRELENISRGEIKNNKLLWFIQFSFFIRIISIMLENHESNINFSKNVYLKTFQTIKVIGSSLETRERSMKKLKYEESNSSSDRAYRF